MAGGCGYRVELKLNFTPEPVSFCEGISLCGKNKKERVKGDQKARSVWLVFSFFYGQIHGTHAHVFPEPTTCFFSNKQKKVGMLPHATHAFSYGSMATIFIYSSRIHFVETPKICFAQVQVRNHNIIYLLGYKISLPEVFWYPIILVLF